MQTVFALGVAFIGAFSDENGIRPVFRNDDGGGAVSLEEGRVIV